MGERDARSGGLVLRVERGHLAVATCDVADGPVTLGSWPGCTIPLDGDEVAPVHAVLDPDGEGRWRLLSLAPGGCRLNGASVVRALVSPGDRLSVGAYEIVLDGFGLHLAPGVEQPLRVRLLWGGTLLDTRVLAPGTPLGVGRGRGVQLELPPELLAEAGSAARAWTAAACLDGVWHVALDTPLRAVDARHGQPLLSGAPRTDGPAPPRGFARSQAWTALPQGAHVRLEAAGFALELERCAVAPPERLARAPWWTTREGQGSIIAGLVALFLVAVLRVPLEGTFVPEEARVPPPSVMAQFRPPAPTPEQRERERLKRLQTAQKDEGARAKAKGVEGEAGRPDAPRRDARRAGPLSDAEIVKRQALLKALEASGRATEQLLSGGALAAAGALGHLTGPQVGDASGMLGLGLRGAGSGGGGGASDTVGTGPIGTQGKGTGYGAGVGRIGRAGPSDLSMDEPERVEGGLDREVIRRVILSHRAQIRYCYEKSLSSKPDLAGKIVSEFVIGPDGRVTTARTASRTLDDEQVSACIESKIRTWTFPKPKGGGVVVVTYPFLFKPSASGSR